MWEPKRKEAKKSLNLWTARESSTCNFPCTVASRCLMLVWEMSLVHSTTVMSFPGNERATVWVYRHISEIAFFGLYWRLYQKRLSISEHRAIQRQQDVMLWWERTWRGLNRTWLLLSVQSSCFNSWRSSFERFDEKPSKHSSKIAKLFHLNATGNKGVYVLVPLCCVYQSVGI